VDIAETASLKERAKKKLERDAGPLIIDALNDLFGWRFVRVIFWR